MSELISGKEAKLAWANGEEVEYYKKERDEWFEVRGNTYVSVFDIIDKFRLKPKTISINGIEVPAPFKPKDGDRFYFIYPTYPCGYGSTCFNNDEDYGAFTQLGAWRTEEEIKQVVSALRSVLNVI